jgi:hypothetical protein
MVVHVVHVTYDAATQSPRRSKNSSKPFNQSDRYSIERGFSEVIRFFCIATSQNYARQKVAIMVGPLFARFAAMPDPDPLGSALSAFFKAWATVTVALALLLGALAVSRIAEDPAAIHHALHLSLIAMGD